MSVSETFTFQTVQYLGKLTFISLSVFQKIAISRSLFRKVSLSQRVLLNRALTQKSDWSNHWKKISLTHTHTHTHARACMHTHTHTNIKLQSKAKKKFKSESRNQCQGKKFRKATTLGGEGLSLKIESEATSIKTKRNIFTPVGLHSWTNCYFSLSRNGWAVNKMPTCPPHYPQSLFLDFTVSKIQLQANSRKQYKVYCGSVVN